MIFIFADWQLVECVLAVFIFVVAKGFLKAKIPNIVCFAACQLGGSSVFLGFISF